MDFFKPIPKEVWTKKYAEEAEQYDKQDSKRENDLVIPPLTREVLKSIVDAEAEEIKKGSKSLSG